MKKNKIILLLTVLFLLSLSPVCLAATPESALYPATGALLENGCYLLGTNVNGLDGEHVNASVTYSIQAGKNGVYALRLLYFTPAEATLTLYVDGVKAGKIPFYPVSEGAWDNSVKSIHRYVNLDAGSHEIKFSRESDDTNYVAIGGLDVISLPGVSYTASASEAALIGSANLIRNNINTLDIDHIGNGASYDFENVEKGNYIARISYYTTADNATHTLTVNHNEAGKFTYTACGEGSWDEFAFSCYAETEISLVEGDNNLTVTATESDINFAAIGDILLIRLDPDETEEPDTAINPETMDSYILYILISAALISPIIKKKQKGIFHVQNGQI